jgi:RHS repeat-associated protein
MRPRWRSIFSGALLAAAGLAVSTDQAPLRAEQSALSRGGRPAGESATVLPDGSVLLIGGETARAAVAIRRPDGRVVPLSTSPSTPRAWHTATLLADGSVLVAGGVDARGRTVAAPERFVPGTSTFDALPADGFAARAHHTATLLTDGRVLLVGGSGGAAARDDADIWDPIAQTARPAGSTLDRPRAGHSADLQADGRVLITGGESSGRDTADLFDPSTGEFHRVGRPGAESASLYVTFVSPADRATDVPLDAGVTLRFSRPVDVRSVARDTIRLTGPNGAETLSLVPAEDGRLVFARPAERLQPSSVYRLNVDGLVTPAGQRVAVAAFSFTTKDDETPRSTDDEAWGPDVANGWKSGRGPSPWQMLPPLSAPPNVTALAGQVLRMNGAPLPDVALEIEGRTARSDRSGRFLVVTPGLATGEHTLKIDSRTANRGHRTYGFYEARITLRAGITTTLPFTIWSPVLDTARAISIPSPTASETVVRTPAIPGLDLHLPAGTVIRDEDHNVVRRLTITPIPLDRTPFPMPTDARFTMFFTIQPGGAYLSTPGPIKGGWLVYPNVTKMKSGSKVQFFNYDPDDKGWYVYGLGTVKGNQVVAEPGTRLYTFTGASFNSGETPAAGGHTPEGPDAGDPVDPSTGAFIMRKTDFSLADVVPLTLTRTYNGLDSQQRAFGTGMSHGFSHFQYTTNSFNDGDLILPDGGRIHYVRISASGLPWYQTVFECQTGPTAFFKSRLAFVNNNWEYALKDGTVYVIGHAAGLQAIRDRYGNETRLTWSAINTFGAGYGNLVRITSPNGRWIEFTYDSAYPVNHVTQAKDNIGRIVTYTYDANGRLETVADAESNMTTYTWDSSNRLTSIEDGRGIVYLTNQYDTSNRVTLQTLADPNATYAFAYTTSGGNITQTDITDPRGHIERFVFDADHYVTSRTQAHGTSLARTTTTTRQAGSNLPTAIVDALNRRTEYTYDTSGHVLTTTRLAGTTDAVTTTFTYEPAFFQLASITDALSHTWSMSYDSAGRLTGTTDPLSHQTTIAISPTGQLSQTTDPLQHSWQYAYSAGDLTSVTDPLGNVGSQFVDQAGRAIASTDPLGRVRRTAFDKLNRVTSVTDPLGGVTTFNYDANSNRLSASDAVTHTTSYTYDTSDRVATRTDPLLQAASFSYDLGDRLTQVTDRKSQVTSVSYDALDRLAQVTYDDSSTVTYTYDAGDRITQIADSGNGTIDRQYDGFDRPTQETTPEGTVDYTYDADGRRSSMTVAGQTAVTYGYDDAHRLTSITQGSAIAAFAYDVASRRTSLTYPNGIVASYVYDNVNQLTGISYALGQTTLGDLTYVYDAAGNVVTVGGSWARASLPPALTSASYDAANRIAAWGGVSSTYDMNGNLTNDGTNTYTWNVRNQLVGLSGGTSASFQYDAFGRRRAKAIGSTTTNFFYDGWNLVQELTSGGTPIANLLTGLAIDETFTRTDAAGAGTLLTDAINSIVETADASGVLQTHYTYEPFGATTISGTSSTNAQQFTSRESDGTGLYGYRARFYSPRLQRFVSEDPLGLNAGMNVYAYTQNQPTRFTDPFGLQTYNRTAGPVWSKPEGGPEPFCVPPATYDPRPIDGTTIPDGAHENKVYKNPTGSGVDIAPDGTVLMFYPGATMDPHLPIWFGGIPSRLPVPVAPGYGWQPGPWPDHGDWDPLFKKSIPSESPPSGGRKDPPQCPPK